VIVVTGAAGFIGSNLVAALNEAGNNDVVACDWLGAQGKWLNLRKRVLRDVVPPEELIAWLAGRKDVRAILHMGADSSTLASDGDAAMRVNFRASLALLDWCTRSGTPLIYASSAATYGAGDEGFDDDPAFSALTRLRPLNLYGWSKHLFDLEVAQRRERDEKLPPACVGLKFFNVYGPNEHHKAAMMSVVNKAYPSAAKGEPIRLFKSHRPDYEDGGQLRDFVYVRDVVDVALWFAKRACDVGVFNVGSGKARAFRDLIGALFDALGQERRIEYVDMPMELREKYQYFTQADLGRLRRLGYNGDMTDVEQGVADFVKRYLSQPDPYR
jgi:ADP-L-glycero-D-manno-heptose 6-epimerase